VGAIDESSNATGVNGDQSNNLSTWSGAAYVFVRNGTTWSQQAYLKASNTAAGDLFGHSVSVYGDTVVVGARGEDSNATGVNGDQSNNLASGSGAAYVFVRNGTTWSQQAYLKASNSESSDYFGHSLSVSGDTIVVGAFFESSNATGVNGNQSNNLLFRAGAAYVFVRHGVTWNQEAYLKASNPEENDYFGESVSVSGDTVVVGASMKDDVANNAGAIYVFDLSEYVNYCTAGTSAHGCQATIYSAGTASASGTYGFSLFAVDVAGLKNGLFFFGTSGQQADPWGNGTSYQCVVPPVVRADLLVGIGLIGLCDGSFAQDLNAFWCSSCPKPTKNPGAGAVVQAQLWYRDPQSTSNQDSSLSDAIEFSLAP
jgi:hypothetical protein